MVESDVIIVGGGPAGAVCALKLREAGISAVILAGEAFPRREVCAGWITPRVVKSLGLGKYCPGTLARFRRFHCHMHGRTLINNRNYTTH